MLVDDQGNWVTDEQSLKSMIQDYYGKLFTKDIDIRPNDTIHRGFPTVPTSAWSILNKKFDDEEVMNAL